MSAKARVGTYRRNRSGITAPGITRTEEPKSPSRAQGSDKAHSASKAAAHSSPLKSSRRESSRAKEDRHGQRTWGPLGQYATKHLQLKMGEHTDSPPGGGARNAKTAKINHTGKGIKEVEELNPNNQVI